MKIQEKGCLIISIILILLSLPLIIGFFVDFLVQKEIESLKKELKAKQFELYRVPYRKDTQRALYEENAYEAYLRGVDMMKSHPESVRDYIRKGASSRYVAIYDTGRLPGKYPFSGQEIIEMASFTITQAETLLPDKRIKVLIDVLTMARDINNGARTYEGCVTGIIVSTYVINEIKSITPSLTLEEAINMKEALKDIENSWYPPESSMFQELVNAGRKSFGLERKGAVWLLEKYFMPERLFSKSFGKLRYYRTKEQKFKGYNTGTLFSEKDYNELKKYSGARRVILDYYELRAHFAQVYTAIDVLNYYRNFKKLPEEVYFDTMSDRNLYLDPFTGKYADYYIDRDTLFISLKNRGTVNTLAYPVN